MGQLLYQVCYTRQHVSLYMWQTEPIPTHCKVTKYYDQGCLKVFLSLSTLLLMIQVAGKSVHLAQKC